MPSKWSGFRNWLSGDIQLRWWIMRRNKKRRRRLRRRRRRNFDRGKIPAQTELFRTSPSSGGWWRHPPNASEPSTVFMFRRVLFLYFFFQFPTTCYCHRWATAPEPLWYRTEIALKLLFNPMENRFNSTCKLLWKVSRNCSETALKLLQNCSLIYKRTDWIQPASCSEKWAVSALKLL